MKRSILKLFIILYSTIAIPSFACTGITLKTKNQETVLGRTIEWGGSLLHSQYVIVPRGFQQQILLDAQGQLGKKFTSKWGYAGLTVEQEQFVVEGLNERGLSMGLFYFPGYGEYPSYSVDRKEQTVSDLQLVSYVLGQYSTVDEAIEGIKKLDVISLDARSSTVHWRIVDKSGRQVVLEIIKGVPHFYENKLGVLTNSPGFEWQTTNLNNYVQLIPGGKHQNKIGDLDLHAFGAGTGFTGLPGDYTPPARFVRAAFFVASTPLQKTSIEAVYQTFHILNNFDIPIGTEFNLDNCPDNIPSATQWTVATDMAEMKLYYRTMFNSHIRCIDLSSIDFTRVSYQVGLLDKTAKEPIELIQIK